MPPPIPCAETFELTGSGGNNSGGIASDASYLYIVNGNKVLKVSKSSRAIVDSVTFTNEPANITVDTNYIWITIPIEDSICIINLTNLSQNTQITGIPAASDIYSDGTYVWITNDNIATLTYVPVPGPPSPGIPILALPVTIALPAGSMPNKVFSDGTNVFVTNTNNGANNNNMSQIDIASFSVVGLYECDNDPFGVYSDGTNVWVANKGPNNVFRFTIGTYTNEAIITVGNNPYNIASDGTYLWVSNFGSDTVTQIEIATNSVSHIVTVGNSPYGITADTMDIWVVNSSTNTISDIKVNGGCGSGADPYVTTISNIRYKLPAMSAPIRFYQGIVDGQMLTINAQLRTIPNSEFLADNFKSYFEYKNKVPASKLKEIEYAIYAKEDMCFYEKFYISYKDSSILVNVWDHKFKIESYIGRISSEISSRADLISKCTGAYDKYDGTTLKFTLGSARLFLSVYANKLIRNSIYLEAPAVSAGNGVVVNTLSVKDMVLKSLDSLVAVRKVDSPMKEKEEWFLDHEGYRKRNFFMAK